MNIAKTYIQWTIQSSKLLSNFIKNKYTAKKIAKLLRIHYFEQVETVGSCRRLCKSTQLCSSFGEHASPTNDGPLHGIRILDLTRILAGPYCTMILGDLGAEIIKVEKPGTGDDTRTWTPPSINEQSCYFVSVNRNKRSLAIDMKTGGDILKKLAEKCDVLVENFLPGTLEKYGLGYESLKSINPRLIYCSISGYGTSGPYVKRGGFDVIAASIGGMLHITGTQDGDPCKVGVAMTDIATGLYAHGAIMAALLQRNITQKGQRIDCNLLSTQLACLVNLGSNYLNAGMEAQRWGTAHESIVPYQAFKTKDNRWLTIGAGSNEQFKEFCETTGLSHLLQDPKYVTNALRVKYRKELISTIQDLLLSKTCNEWLEILKQAKFPYGPVNDLNHAFKDPQVQHNKMVVDLGECKVVGPAVSYSYGKNSPRSSPPKLGEHTRQVLKDLIDMSDIQIDELYESKIVQ